MPYWGHVYSIPEADMMLATFAGAEGKALLGYVDPDCEMIVDLQGQHRASFGTSNIAFESMQGLIEDGERVLDLVLRTVGAGSPEDAVTYPLSAVRLLPPVPVPRQIRGFAMCAPSSCAPAGDQHGCGAEAATSSRERPQFYLANRFNVVGPGADVEWPAYAGGRLDCALKIGMILGNGGKDIAPERAHKHIFGYTIFNGFSARQAQCRGADARLGAAKGKSFDAANVIGPWIVTADEIPDVRALQATVRVNGEIRSRGSTAGMRHSFEDMIALVSSDETLHAGEFFASGVISEAGGREVDRWLRPEDVIELEVSGIGVLRNRVVIHRRMSA